MLPKSRACFFSIFLKRCRQRNTHTHTLLGDPETNKKDIKIVRNNSNIHETHKVHAPKIQGVFFLGVLKRRRQCITHAPCWKTSKQTKVYPKFGNIRKYTKHQ